CRRCGLRRTVGWLAGWKGHPTFQLSNFPSTQLAAPALRTWRWTNGCWSKPTRAAARSCGCTAGTHPASRSAATSPPPAATIGPRSRGWGSTWCAGRRAGGEVVVGGRKLVGSAQVRHRTALLQHGSILLEGSQEIIGAISREPSAIRGGTTLAAVLGRPVSFDEVAEAVVQSWGNAVTAAAPYRPLPPFTAFFSAPAWTWRR